MPSFSVQFAYNSTNSIPAVGAQRKTFNVIYANGNETIANSLREEEMIDFSRRREVLSETRILKFHLGRAILEDPANRDWFRSFFKANYRWAVFGNFKDTANAANDNLCLCNPPDDHVEVTMERDMQGYELISTKVF